MHQICPASKSSVILSWDPKEKVWASEIFKNGRLCPDSADCFWVSKDDQA